MLLTIDIGNTNIVLGLFKGNNLIHHWRCESKRNKTVDEYICLFYSMLSMHHIEPSSIHKAAICSVVPPIQPILTETVQKFFSIEPFIVDWRVKTGISILYSNPSEVGADRIMNAVAAYERYKQAVIIVDFGTATTFDLVSANGEYIGGAIAPGISISMDALFYHTAKLPRVEFIKPRDVVGMNTIESIQSGTYYGYASLVEGLIQKIKDTLLPPVNVIATGGLASVIYKDCKLIDDVDKELTLHGIRMVYEKNNSEK